MIQQAVDPQKCIVREQRFLVLYSIILVISFSPIKALGQLSAIIFITGLIFFVQLQPRRHLLTFISIVLIYSFVGLFYYLIMPDFSFSNYYLFFVTASSFLVLFCDLKYIASARLLRKLAMVSGLFMFFEALFGITQALVGSIRSGSFDLNNGDVVRGTIEPHFNPSNSASNAMFAILLSVLFLFVFATAQTRVSFRHIILYGVTLLAWLLASVLHVLIFFMGAVLIAYLLLLRLDLRRLCLIIPKQLGMITRGIATVLLLVIVVVPILLPANVSSARVFFDRTVSFDEGFQSEKVHATFNTLFLLPDKQPIQPFVGLGPGQYSSRAALMNTGMYLQSGRLPFRPYINPMTKQYIIDPFQSLLAAGSYSSSLFPFYSWLSLYGETGFLGLLIIFVLVLRAILILRKRRSYEFPQMNFAMLALIIFICLLGFQDNYWEFTQAIFPPILILVLCLTYLHNESQGFPWLRTENERMADSSHQTMP